MHCCCLAHVWVVNEEDYTIAGLESLVDRAKAAMQDPEYAEITAEYHKAGGICDTDKVFTMRAVHDALLQAASVDNKMEIEHVVGAIPWLADAASESRMRYLASAAETVQAKKSRPTSSQPAPPDADERKKRVINATGAAATKIGGGSSAEGKGSRG
jgi:hypothetical protein